MRSWELTPEEKAKPYAKYFSRPVAAPDPAHLELMARPIDPSKALMPENINDLLNPGYLDVETGWCVLPNGAAYIANMTTMPDVSIGMINWWFAWHGLADLNYKIWYPKCHFGISIPDAEERARVLDPSTPMVKRFQGITHHVIEDIGGGPEEIFIPFMTPEEAGFDMERFNEEGVTLICANGRSRPVDGSRPWAPAVVCHLIRPMNRGGVEYRTRFWIGYAIENKKFVCKLPPDFRIPEAAPQGLAIHNVHEYTNLASFLPELYKEMTGQIAV
ncbi:MAG: hydrolase [Holophagaceae bacterium]|nr:hydrolase [Holophagaceae bacterium]